MPWGIVTRPTLVSLATARVVNRVWIKIPGQLMHIVLFATEVTTHLLLKFTHQRTPSGSGQRFVRPTFAALEPHRGPLQGVEGDPHVPHVPALRRFWLCIRAATRLFADPRPWVSSYEGLGIGGVCLKVLQLANRIDGHKVANKSLCFQML